MTENPRFDQLLAQGLEASRDNRTDAALELFAQASAAAPGSGVPHFLMGSEHASAGDIQAAELAFANAVLLAPEFHLARYQLGLLQFSSDRAAVALITWQPLFSLPESDPLRHFVSGFAALAQDRFQEALHHYRAGLQRNDDNPAVSADIGKVIAAVEQLMQPPAAGQPAAAASHVLLSGYSKGMH
ncbi:tetratricopeptide repeat protein [Ramlibacter pallidus]|uniref:Tetratricopeptide repeat protein n=1 Tax=Ramlibacter pallidus TaxID=2780087 RepID=A0ABR9S0Y5_9BURK|nr:hypothetical protein [Ramlibacter pallidus]MBE7367179.1 hypothetical protein [Ramlibacter pallidus]